MRALLPEPADSVDVIDFYARGWLGTGGVRANMLASVDGAVTANGKSGGLQTPGDHRVFAALRDLADVVLVGSVTAATENYGPGRQSPDAADRRRALGLDERLPIAVVSRSLRLGLGTRLFADPDHRPLVVSVATADPELRRRVGDVADVLVCGDDEIDFAAVRAALADRGLRHVLSEGGPTVLSALTAQGQLDELCLSVTPLLAGPGAGRILGGPDWDTVTPLRLLGALEEDGALFLRYRARPEAQELNASNRTTARREAGRRAGP